MRKARLLFAFAVILLAGSMLWAQAADKQMGWQEFPIAAIDNIFIPYSNPSLLATGNASGIGLVHMADNEQFVRRYWLMLNSDALSYVYERNEGTNYHLLALSTKLFPANILPNLYAGTNYRFESGEFDFGTFRTGLTYRPRPYASLAFTWDNPMKGKPFYRGGLALRPLAFIDGVADHRLELSMDMNYSNLDPVTNTIGDYTFKKPILGINTQVLDGVKLGATYNLEEETALVSFSLSRKTMELGSMARLSDGDKYGYAYGHLSDKSFRPFLGRKSPQWYKMPIKGSVVSYKAPKYEIGPFKIYDKDTRDLQEIVCKLEEAKADPNINGILLVNPAFATSFGLQQELVTAFEDFKSDGKKIAIYFNNISNGGYLFASSIADKIYLNPMGSLDLRGIAINSPYLNDMLTSLGIETINFRSHKYKNAGNMFSESEMTTAEREVYESILESIYQQMISQIERGRAGKVRRPVRDIIDEGPYLVAQTAVDLGLVDELIYEDELSDRLKEDFSFNRRSGSLAGYRPYDWSQPKESDIAVIYASGNIVMGKGKPGHQIAHENTVKLIRDARKDNRYKGIILRVDSGGGSAQASDIILRELELAQTENNKPVVVSMAGVAASGGYYIAAKADLIVANPSTLTGSIGVIGLAFTATEAFEKIKVNWSTVKKGERSDMGSLTRRWTVDEKAIMTSFIEYTYDDFVNKVAAGRKELSVEDVYEIAQGRIWTGEQAKANGLIDELGGLETAARQMRELAGIKGKMRLIDATSSDSGISVEITSKPILRVLGLDAIETLNSEYTQIYEMWRDFQDENALMLSPLRLENIKF